MNTKLNKLFTVLFILIALVAGTVSPALAQTKRKPRLRRTSRTTARKVVTPAPVYYSVHAGQLIRVRLNHTITSESARIGDQFSTTVVDPVYSGGIEVIPAGSTVTGQVSTVQRAARKSKAGSIGVRFVSLRLPSGIARAINGAGPGTDAVGTPAAHGGPDGDRARHGHIAGERSRGRDHGIQRAERIADPRCRAGASADQRQLAVIVDEVEPELGALAQVRQEPAQRGAELAAVVGQHGG